MKFIAIFLCITFLSFQQIPNAIDIFFKKGLESSQSGNYEQAIKDFSKAISLNANYAEAYYNRGIVFFEMKQNEKGMADFDKAINLMPDNGMFYFQRGNKKWLMLDKEGACMDWNKSNNVGFILAEEVLKEKCKAWIEQKP